MEGVLGKVVLINDDQSEDSMYDLRVGTPDDAELAIECVRATDPLLRAVFGTLKKRLPLTGSFSGHWIIELRREAIVKEIYTKLPILLAEMESHGLDCTRNLQGLTPRHHFLLDELEDLGIGFAYLSVRSKASVEFLPPGSGGAVDEHGESVPTWISEFLFEPSNADVVNKLLKARARKKEVFIRADEYGVPWSVASYLTDDLIHVPTAAPELQNGIDGVWLIYGTRGVRWDGEKWYSIKKD